MQFACNKNRIPLLLAVTEFFISLFRGKITKSLQDRRRWFGEVSYSIWVGLRSLWHCMYRNRRSIAQTLEAPSPPPFSTRKLLSTTVNIEIYIITHAGLVFWHSSCIGVIKCLHLLYIFGVGGLGETHSRLR
jgi:hypothetical protein